MWSFKYLLLILTLSQILWTALYRHYHLTKYLLLGLNFSFSFESIKAMAGMINNMK